MINRYFGLREKLLLPLIIGLFMIIFVLIFFWQPLQLQKARQEFIDNQTRIIQALMPGIIQNLVNNDLDALYRLLENSKKIHQQEWRYIQLHNKDNKHLYPRQHEDIETRDTLVHIDVPITENGTHLGTISLYTDWKSRRDHELKNIHQLSLITVFVFALTGIFSFVLQTRTIYQPLAELKDITSRFADGDYQSPIQNRSADEIGSLARSIDNMREKIVSSINQISEKEKMQRAILETAPDAIITINDQGLIQSFNPGAEKIFHYRKWEVIGKNVNILMQDDIAARHDEYVHNYNITTPVTTLGINQELHGKRKDGSLFPVEITINAKIIDNAYLFTGVIRDITERKKIEQLKNEFVATVSHELRTPLTAIKGSLDLVSKGLGLELPQQATTMLDVANRNVERLLNLINDILDMSKLESSEMQFVLEKIDIKALIQDCIELNQEYAKKYATRFVCVECPENTHIHADRDRLIQVMSNLLSNAAKFSPQHVDVEIRAEIEDQHIRISVTDYGPGIDKAFQNVLFDKFTQSSSGDTRQVGGTGLGLSISKIIVEKLGGHIDFHSQPGKHTTFYFKLPLANARGIKKPLMTGA